MNFVLKQVFDCNSFYGKIKKGSDIDKCVLIMLEG